MSDIDVIGQLARQALSVPLPAGKEDLWLWDRTLRILRNIEHICRMPELAGQAMAIDRFCLIAAAYFADSGFASYAEGDNPDVPVVLADISLSDLCSLSTRQVSQRLAETVPGARIDRINRIITESSNRFTNLTEAMILSDARNLDDMGAVGLYNECRRNTIHGKGISEMLENWKRKVDYRYWQARLKESFHFESVRQLARQRLEVAEIFMNRLAVENAAQDLQTLAAGSAEG